MKCKKCEADTFMPFRCQYCGGYFCAEHRLPESHECPRMDLARISKEAQPMTGQEQKGYEYTVTYSPFAVTRKKSRFSSKEILHLGAATLLVIGVGLSLVDNGGLLSINLTSLGLFVTMFTASFFIHEIAHKIVAQRNGLWAEFRLTLFGAVLTLFSLVSPFKIISPGAVMIAGFGDARKIGKISIAGPAVNMVLSAVFLAATLVPNPYMHVFALGAAFNAWIALFNLIPFGIFDGFKIFQWDKVVWALSFAASLALTMVSYLHV